MASRVYWKGLRLILSRVERYIERYDDQLAANLTTPQRECVSAVLIAVSECLALLPPNTPVDAIG